MPPSIVTHLLVGVLTTVFGLIQASSAWIVGSEVIGGHTFYDKTNNATPSVYVNTDKIITYTNSGVSLTTNGRQTGAVLKTDGYPAAQWVSVACTATGGTNAVGGYYNTCNVKNPVNASGSLVFARFACDNPQLSITSLSGGYLLATTANATKTAGSDVFVNARPRPFDRNQTVGTGGSLVLVGSGGMVWNPALNFVLQTSKVIPRAGVATDCRFDYQFMRHYGF